MAEVRDYRALYGREHLGAWDMPENGAVVTIAEVIPGEVRSGGEGSKRKVDKRPILRLRGTTKTFVCNSTNGATIAQLYGKDPAGWIGKAITLYATTTQFGGKTVDCIRVRPQIPQRKSGERPPQTQTMHAGDPTPDGGDA
jgi:hypothetical protein